MNSNTSEHQITILDKHKHLKSFETPEEFNKYYSKHKSEIDAKSTNQLNKEYHIEGFKITKRNMKIIDGVKVGDLHLKPLKHLKPEEIIDESKNINETIDDIYAKINQLNDLYMKLASVINSLISET